MDVMRAPRHQGHVPPRALRRRPRPGLRRATSSTCCASTARSAASTPAAPAGRGRQGGPGLQGLRLHPARETYRLPRRRRAPCATTPRTTRGGDRPTRVREALRGEFEHVTLLADSLDWPRTLGRRLRRHRGLRQLHRARALRRLRRGRVRRRPRLLVQREPRLRHDPRPRGRARAPATAPRSSPAAEAASTGRAPEDRERAAGLSARASRPPRGHAARADRSRARPTSSAASSSCTSTRSTSGTRATRSSR